MPACLSDQVAYDLMRSALETSLGLLPGEWISDRASDVARAQGHISLAHNKGRRNFYTFFKSLYSLSILYQNLWLSGAHVL